jgi:transcriptional regulator with XRE-family HTH domain
MPKIKRGPTQKEIQAGIGKRMAWARNLTMPNQSKVARLLGVDPSTLNKIEEGDRAPNVFLVAEFCNRFRVSTDYLLRGILTDAEHPAIAARLAAEHPELGQQQMPGSPFRGTGTN